MDYFNQTSNRLRFRKMTQEDVPKWAVFFVEKDHLQYLGIDVKKTPNVLATRWIDKQLKRYAESGLGHLAVELKETGEFIGVGGILPRALNGKEEYEIAYSLIPQFWGKGFGTEIAQQMKLFGEQTQLSKRFISIIHQENVASIRVAQKNGMHSLYETTYLGMEVFVFGTSNSGK